MADIGLSNRTQFRITYTPKSQVLKGKYFAAKSFQIFLCLLVLKADRSLKHRPQRVTRIFSQSLGFRVTTRGSRASVKTTTPLGRAAIRTKICTLENLHTLKNDDSTDASITGY
jgi:hypothetical protein